MPKKATLQCRVCKQDKKIKRFRYRKETKDRSPICKACLKYAGGKRKPKRPKKKRGKADSFEKENGLSYASRNRILKTLGYTSYRNYLNGAVWKSIRKRVFASIGRDCVICRHKATALHHSRYHADDLTGKTLEFIFPICSLCHTDVEFSDGGRKKSMAQAQRKFELMLKASFDF